MKILNHFTSKTLFLCVLSVLAVVSCSKADFNIGADIVDGDKISPGEISFPVKAWSVTDFSRDTLSGRADEGHIYDPNDAGSGIMQFFFNMVGHYVIPNVCTVDAGFATEVQLLASIANYGDIIVDSVDMIISYTPLDTLVASTQGYLGYDTCLEIYKGVMDPQTYMVYGNPYSYPMNLEIYRLGEEIPEEITTDANKVTKENFIPLNKKWALAEMIHSESFYMELDTVKSTSNIVDTVFTFDDEGNVTDTTFTYADSIYPRMKLRLETEYWQKIMDDWAGKVMTTADFSDYFRGLYFKAADGILSPLMMFNLFQTPQGTDRTAEICIHYRTSAATGMKAYLNFFNSATGEINAANSINVTYDPRVTATLENPDTLNGEKDLYILPFGGSEVVVDLISEENLEMIREEGWIINDAYIEFKNKGFDTSIGNFPAIELWMYRHPYGYQFIYYDDEFGYPMQKVDYYLSDEATFTLGNTGQWLFTPSYDYGINGIINENSNSTTFSKPGIYRMRVTRTLIDLIYNARDKVRLGLRLPLGVTQLSPFMSILDGTDLKLNIKYTTIRDTSKDE